MLRYQLHWYSLPESADLCNIALELLILCNEVSLSVYLNYHCCLVILGHYHAQRYPQLRFCLPSSERLA